MRWGVKHTLGGNRLKPVPTQSMLPPGIGTDQHRRTPCWAWLGAQKRAKPARRAERGRANGRRNFSEGGFAGVAVREVGRIVRGGLGEIFRRAVREAAVEKALDGRPAAGKSAGIRPVRTPGRRPRRGGIPEAAVAQNPLDQRPCGGSMKAMTFICPPHFGQASGSTS